jgi:hypothetical protein
MWNNVRTKDNNEKLHEKIKQTYIRDSLSFKQGVQAVVEYGAAETGFIGLNDWVSISTRASERERKGREGCRSGLFAY